MSQFKERNRDIEIGSWQHDVQNMDSLRTYKLLKTDFGCERYLKDIKTSSFKQIPVKFRGGLLDLRANSGKFEGLSIERRFCKLCNTAVENEYHFLFVCSYNGSLRKQFLPDYFVNYPSESKFKYLMNNVTLKTNICKYLIEALKLRSELLLMHRI